MKAKPILAARALAASAVLLASSLPAAAQTPVSPGQLVGHWHSAAPENLGAFYAVRSFVFTEGSWALVFKTAADAEFAKPLFTLRIDGSYAVGKLAAQPAGATEAAFFYSRRYVRADSPSGAAFFQSQGCTLQPGVETDVSLNGCGFVPSITASGIEYDLLQLKGEQLLLGDRSGDLAKARPTALSAFALVKR